MELGVLLFNREQLVHYLFSVLLHVALPDPALIPICLDQQRSASMCRCWLAFLRFAGGAKALVVGVCLFIFQDAGMCDTLTCRVKLLCSGNDGVERDPRGAIPLPLLYQRINGTFYEIERALSLWLVHRRIEPGGSLRGGRFTRRSQSSPPVPVARLHDRLPSCPFL